MRAVLFDTNTFLRFLLNDIAEQANATAAIVQKAKRKELTINVPQIVIFEIYFALDKYYKLKKDEIVDKLRLIVSTEYFHVQDQKIFNKAIALFRDRNIDLVDCFLLYKAEKEGTDLFTFDKTLKNLSKKL